MGRYNIGRDQIVGNLTGTTIEPRTVTNQSTFSGSSSYSNYTYQTDVTYVSGLLNASSGKSTTTAYSSRIRSLTDTHSDGVNHGDSVETDQYPAIDGLVAVLTVKITGRPETEADK